MFAYKILITLPPSSFLHHRNARFHIVRVNIRIRRRWQPSISRQTCAQRTHFVFRNSFPFCIVNLCCMRWCWCAHQNTCELHPLSIQHTVVRMRNIYAETDKHHFRAMRRFITDRLRTDNWQRSSHFIQGNKIIFKHSTFSCDSFEFIQPFVRCAHFSQYENCLFVPVCFGAVYSHIQNEIVR